jgi:hypothetical protein
MIRRHAIASSIESIGTDLTQLNGKPIVARQLLTGRDMSL